jgi:hypothetical protein
MTFSTPGWRNWQTQQTQNLPTKVLWVRPPPRAPLVVESVFMGRSDSSAWCWVTLLAVEEWCRTQQECAMFLVFAEQFDDGRT